MFKSLCLNEVFMQSVDDLNEAECIIEILEWESRNDCKEIMFVV